MFNGSNQVIAYYLPGTKKWGPTFADSLTVLWNPQVQTGDASFGVHGLPALATLRFGLGRTTTEPEIDHAAACVINAVKRLRSGSVADIAAHPGRIRPGATRSLTAPA